MNCNKYYINLLLILAFIIFIYLIIYHLKIKEYYTELRNYNKPWRKLESAFNSDNINHYPFSNLEIINAKHLINNYLTYDQLQFATKHVKLNYNSFTKPNIIANDFKNKLLIILNNLSSLSNQVKKYGKIKLDILKYYYNKIDDNKINDKKIYELYIILYQHYDTYMHYFYLKTDFKNIYYKTYVGATDSSSELLLPGYNKLDIKNGAPNNIDKNSNLYLKDPKTNKKNMFGFKQYTCFNAETNTEYYNTPMNYNSKDLCESAYTWYEKPKPKGVYDKPCQKDEDCPFYNANKNYKNNYGGCKNNYCEMPLGIRPLGFTKFDKNYYKPLCYNCNTTKWKSITDLDNCCEKQKNNKFLKSPDYAFKYDWKTRLSHN